MVSAIDNRYDCLGLSLYPDSVNNYRETPSDGGVSTRTITDWLYDNGFGQKASKIWKCESGAVELIDDNHHRFAHVCQCRDDICPTCAQQESDRHKQRYGRVLQKMRWISKIKGFTLGYVVLTIPKHLRYKVLSSKMLKEFHRKGWECLLEIFGVDGGVTTLHFFGEVGKNSGVWNPHLNILFPIQGSGFVDADLLADLKAKWGDILTDWLGVECSSESNVWYSYRATEAHLVHSVKYVTRSTIGSHFMDASVEVREFLASLYYFNNVRWYGKLSYRNWKSYLAEIAESNNLAFDDIVLEQKSACECLICGDALRANIEIKSLKIELSEEFEPSIDVETGIRFSVVIVTDGKWFDGGKHWFSVAGTSLKADLPTYIEYLLVKQGFTVDDVQEHLKTQHGVNHSDVVEIRSGNDDLIEKGVIKMTVFSHIRAVWTQLHHERPDQFPAGDVFDLDEMLEDGADVKDFREIYRRSRRFLDVALEIKEIHKGRGWNVG
ncbi:hypothetical protein IH992_04090 [Candidatus Poribacteria bacterium]|nr:hypothetical protein [Candidatus Poribacteria bacterium]